MPERDIDRAGPGGFILESGWESDFDLKNWLFLVSRCSHRRIYYNSQN